MALCRTRLGSNEPVAEPLVIAFPVVVGHELANHFPQRCLPEEDRAEPGEEKLTPELLARAVASTVNLAEVQTKLVSRGWTSNEAWEDATSPIREILPFDEEHARKAGDLVIQTQNLGLSLGDRACLALGMALKAPVYTAETSWKKLKVSVRIHVIR